MFKKRLSLVLSVVLFLGICICILYFGMSKIRSNSISKSLEIANASKEFKEQVGFREAQAKKLLPYLKVGMNKKDIVSLLGKPDFKAESEYYDSVSYSIGYSNLLTVYFDKKGIVINVDSVWTAENQSPIERVWPLLCTGMTKQDVAVRLGGPQEELNNGREWQYQYRDEPPVFTVTFDANDKVVKLEKN